MIGGPYSQTFRSTLLAPYVRLQFPFRSTTPYAEVAAGAVVVSRGEAERTACYYESGVGGSVSGGIDFHPVPSFAFGLRGGVRNPGWTSVCSAQGGAWSFEHSSIMGVGSLTASFRW